MVPELFCKNIPESLYIENMGAMLPWVSDAEQILRTLLP